MILSAGFGQNLRQNLCSDCVKTCDIMLQSVSPLRMEKTVSSVESESTTPTTPAATMPVKASYTAAAKASVSHSSSNIEGQFHQVKSKRKPTAKSIVGSVASNSSKLVAANPIIQKAIFQVDNIANNIGTEEIIDHLAQQNIPVISVFECQSWRRLSSPGADMKAIRLCVEKHVADRILLSETWPQDILVRPWKFKSPPTDISTTPVS